MFYIFHFQLGRLFIKKKKKLNPYVRIDIRVLQKFPLPSLPICDSLEIYEMRGKSQAMAGNKNNVNGKKKKKIQKCRHAYSFLKSIGKTITILISWHFGAQGDIQSGGRISTWCRNTDEQFILEAGVELKTEAEEESHWSFTFLLFLFPPLPRVHARVFQ